MDDGMRLINSIKPEQSMVEAALRFDPNKLEATRGETISKYCIALAQYLIYFKSQQNETKVKMLQLERFIDSSVHQLLTKEVLKTYKTKKDATAFIIFNSEVLSAKQQEIYDLQDELLMVDGKDKVISELIATFKRELTRRENELYATRKEMR